MTKIEEYNDVEETALFITFLIVAFIMFILASLHTYEVMSDLCTEQRKSINHRVSKPEKKRNYKLLQYLTLIVILLYFAYGLSHAIAYALSLCHALAFYIGFFVMAKCIMYIVFMYRLDIAYKKSAYGYSRKFIAVMVGLNSIFAVLFPILTGYVMYIPASYGVDDDEFPNPCYTSITGVVLLVPVVVLLWDVIMNILSLCLFIIPLRKTMKAITMGDSNDSNHSIQTSSDKQMKKMTGKMLYLAIKYTVLTGVAATSTIVLLLILMMAPVIFYVSSFDVVINSICIMLMTAYYPDDKYYQRLCGCCLYVCCPKKAKKYKSKASKGAEVRKGDDPSTKDTTQVYHQAMAKRVSVQTQATATATATVTQTELTDREEPIGKTQTITMEPMLPVVGDVTPEPHDAATDEEEP